VSGAGDEGAVRAGGGRDSLYPGGLSPGIVLDLPERLTEVTSWHSHLPFAFWCVDALRPRVLVELGTHKGDSYSGFCQAVKRLGLTTACYAVDSWRGDHEAGYYGDEVLEELRAWHDPRYAAFSRLVRATFDEALAHFKEGTIDLLHIDGLHTYEAVRHDFETWRPKLSDRGVVLFHDINVREQDFGAWRFWEEVRARYPHFTFLHGHGLGVLLVGAQPPDAALRLVACTGAAAEGPRALFAGLGNRVDLVASAGPESELRKGLEKRLAGLEAEGRRLEAERLGLEAERLRLEAERLRLEAALARAGSETLIERRTTERWRREVEVKVRELAATRSELATVSATFERYRASWPSRLGNAVASAARLPRQLLHLLGAMAEGLGWAARLRLPEWLRLRRYERLIRRACLLDRDFYLAQCPDDASARENPVRHYLLRGAAQGLNPNPWFDTIWYIERNRAAAEPDKSPLVHYLRQGARYNLEPGPDFDTAYYLRKCPGAATSGLSPLSHYLVHGRVAGFPCSPRALVASGARNVLEAPGLQVPPRNRVLVVDHRLLTPDQDSGSVRMFAIIRLLRELGHEVTFVSDSETRLERYEAQLLPHVTPLLFGAEEAVEHLWEEGGSYRHVLLARPDQARRYLESVRALAPQAAVLYDTVDLHWVRMSRAAELSGDEGERLCAERYRVLERDLAAAVDLVVAITEQERQLLLAEVPAARVAVVPNVHTLQEPGPGPKQRKDLFFIGGFEHHPNVDAVQWFVGEVLPIVRQACPEAVFRVVGSMPPPEVLTLASAHVEVVGYVADPGPCFHGCRVFVSPLRYGAGMKGKIGQAMSYGLPVVTTSIGAEGMGLVDGENALVADGAAAFAQAVVRLYEDDDLWHRLAARSRAHVEARYSEKAVRPLLAALFPVAAGSTGIKDRS
jgi:glycosyltransferase involved in cell wall biosynthesis